MKRRSINSHWHPVRNLFSNERFVSRGVVNKKNSDRKFEREIVDRRN